VAIAADALGQGVLVDALDRLLACRIDIGDQNAVGVGEAG